MVSALSLAVGTILEKPKHVPQADLMVGVYTVACRRWLLCKTRNVGWAIIGSKAAMLFEAGFVPVVVVGISIS